MNAFRSQFPIALALSITVLLLGLAQARAHHAFATEFQEAESELRGVVTKVWWTNPHIRYDLDVSMPDGSVEKWSLHPPGNLPTYRRENWTRDTIQEGFTVYASGNLGRNGTKKLYATCINIESGPENGRQLGRCVSPASTNRITADPTVDYTYKANSYAVDITGFWDNRYNFRTTVDDFDPKPMPLTATSRSIYEGRVFGDDPALRCQPVGLPRIFGSPYPVQIADTGSHYLMVSMQDNTPRWVYMDGRSAPADQPLTTMGFSTGHWEGRTLVIETTHLSSSWLDGSGYPMSGGDDTRIIERWRVADDALTIDRTMTIHDPLYATPLVRTRGSQRGDASELLESPPCDPTVFLNEMMENGRLEEILGVN